MLTDLVIRDLALIDRAAVAFDPGLNVVSGETGAGKTLLVASLELLLGQTPRGGAARWVREGAREARVEGRFELDGPASERVRATLRSHLPDLAADRAADGARMEVILGRALGVDGKTRAFVDQRPVPLRALKAIAPDLIEVHGQNDHQRLLDPVEQTALTDDFAGTGVERGAYLAARELWRTRSARLHDLDTRQRERTDRLDLLRFQAHELENAGLEMGERERLEGERRLLRDADEVAGDLDAFLAQVSEGEGALVDRMGPLDRLLARWAEAFDELAPAMEDLRASAVHLSEASARITSFRDGIEANPARLEEIETRLVELDGLERKHATDQAGLMTRMEELVAEVESLEGEEQDLATLDGAVAVALEELEEAAAVLGAKREGAAPELSTAVEAVLARLGLEGARVTVSLVPFATDQDPSGRFGPLGAERVEILLAANPGEPERPLREVASGGEAARIMLALRTVLGGGLEGGGRTLVFDEIDSGVGGRLGPEVGEHLRSLSAHDQVLCVTHLPAIAAAAVRHLRVEKEVEGGRTFTRITELAGEGRVAEVADMIAGGADAETARAEARRLLAR